MLIFSSLVICAGSDYFVTSSGRGLSLFAVGKYEYVKDEESSELADISIRNIANINDYENFLDNIEKLETDFTDSNIMQFYMFLEKLDCGDVNENMYVCEHVSIRMHLEFI